MNFENLYSAVRPRGAVFETGVGWAAVRQSQYADVKPQVCRAPGSAPWKLPPSPQPERNVGPPTASRRPNRNLFQGSQPPGRVFPKRYDRSTEAGLPYPAKTLHEKTLPDYRKPRKR